VSPSDPIDAQRRQVNRLRLLADSAHAFSEATNDVTRLLKVVAERFASLVGDGCYIRLLAADGVSLEPVATHHPDPAIEAFLRETTDHIPLRVGEGISGRVVQTGDPVLMPQVPFEQYRKMTKPEFVPIFERIGVSSMIVVCLRARATSLGFIALVRNGSGRPAYTEEDLDLAKDLADRAALAIDNARLLRDVEQLVALRTAELQRANQELEAFSYSVSHDLRTPLRAIDGFSRVLEEDHLATLDAEGRRVISVIRKNTQRMGQLIDHLLHFAQLGRQSLRLVSVDMTALVEAVVDEWRKAEPSRVLDFRLGELPSAVGDPNLLRQVWSNLLGNAVKYTRQRSPAVIEVWGQLDGAELAYTIRDNGAGFDPEYSAKLFKVFERLHTNAQFEGTGVGLAIVQRIVVKHGGRVWAEGRPGEGATFGFSLPRREASVLPAGAE
jgi:signal transduction histidine kinase